MNLERLSSIILAPLMTEKSSRVADKHKQFVFKVVSGATKLQIRQAIETLFNVSVKKVNTVTIKPMQKRFGRNMGTRSGWKKAYVSLEEGFDIQFMEVQK